MSFQVGDKIGDYEVIGILGAGGMGRVYKVKNVFSERIDAMKVLLPNLADEPELADRFLREIKVLASLNHPNIAGLHTALSVQNQLIMVMEYVDGVTVEQKLKAGPLPLPQAIEYTCEVLAALGYAHSRGVVHRDIKPANMMLTTDNVIKLMDFGIAKSKTDRKLTMTGTTMGSLFYMSPEQVQGGAIDPRSDLYSVGVSLYEMVTGAKPFQGKSDYDLMVAQLQQAPLPPIQVQPGLPQMLNDAILLVLQKDPAQRFQTAEAFKVALESLRSSLAATPASSPQPAAVAAASSGATGLFSGTPPSIAQGAPSAGPASVLPPAVPVAAQTAQAGGHRALYMTLGAIVALAVIVVGATELPRFLRTRAGANQKTEQPAGQSSSTSPPAQQPPDAQVGQPTGGSSNPGTVPENPSPISTAGQIPAKPAEAQAPTGGLPPASGAVSSSEHPAGTMGTKAAAKPRATGRSSVDGSGAAASQAGGSTTAQPSQRTPASSGEELDKLQEHMTALAGRANAIKDSVDNLRNQQKSAGLSLRPDISASQTRMEQYMDNADQALKAGNTGAARRNMDLAEKEIDKLEAFFGR